MYDADDQSLAAQAYRAAEQKIEEALRQPEALTEFSLGDGDFKALTVLPPRLLELKNLRKLDVSNTSLTSLPDLGVLPQLLQLEAENTSLRSLDGIQNASQLEVLDAWPSELETIDQIGSVTDLEAAYLDGSFDSLPSLATLKSLRVLYLHSNALTDLSALTGLPDLEQLELERLPTSSLAALGQKNKLTYLSLLDSGFTDLRPLLHLAPAVEQLFLAGCLALERDPELAKVYEAAHAENDNTARAVYAYLRTLPPYPEPLPWLSDGATPDAETAPIPAPQPAPIVVGIENDRIVRVSSETDLDAAQRDLAEQGWASLRASLEDLADHRGRIGNALPNLARALSRLDAALGARFSELDAISVGTHARRIQLQAPMASERLDESDAAEIEALAAALALFMDRFEMWRRYVEQAERDPIPPADVEAALPDVKAMTDALKDMEEVAPDIPKELDALAEDAATDPEDGVASKGLAASLGNALSALALAAKPVLAKARSELKDVAGKTYDSSKATFSKILGVSLGTAAAGFIVATAATLRGLATQFPQALGWLANFLRAFGLL